MTRLIALANTLAFVTSVANAQTPVMPPARNCTPTQALPGDNGIATKKQPDQPLTDKLAKSDGVLCPPPSADSEMRVPAPDAGASNMPVIRPPGSPGGDPSVRPK